MRNMSIIFIKIYEFIINLLATHFLINCLLPLIYLTSQMFTGIFLRNFRYKLILCTLEPQFFARSREKLRFSHHGKFWGKNQVP